MPRITRYRHRRTEDRGQETLHSLAGEERQEERIRRDRTTGEKETKDSRTEHGGKET